MQNEASNGGNAGYIPYPITQPPQPLPENKEEPDDGLSDLFEVPHPHDRDMETADLFEVPDEHDNDMEVDDLVEVSDEDIFGGDEDMSDVLGLGDKKPKPKMPKVARRPIIFRPPPGLGGLRL